MTTVPKQLPLLLLNISLDLPNMKIIPSTYLVPIPQLDIDKIRSLDNVLMQQ
jgi:hypothetical protein